MRYFNSSGDPATFSDLWSYIFGDIWKEMREQQLQASYRLVSVVQGSGGVNNKTSTIPKTNSSHLKR